MRETVLVAFSRLKEVSASFAELRAIHEAADRLTKALRERWPEFGNAENLLPRWPALNERPA